VLTPEIEARLAVAGLQLSSTPRRNSFWFSTSAAVRPRSFGWT
jgi:hypothetical protein